MAAVKPISISRLSPVRYDVSMRRPRPTPKPVRSAATVGGRSMTSSMRRPITDAAVEGQDPAVSIRRGQTAGEAVDDVLVERLQIRDLSGRARQAQSGVLEPIGQRPAEKRDGDKQQDVVTRGV